MHEQITFLKTLADPTRLTLLKLILPEELCVCELQALLQISQPAVSQHIAKLKAAGLVTERRAGMWTYYRANSDRLQQGLTDFAAFLQAEIATIPTLSPVAERLRTLSRVELCCDKGES